VDKRICSTSKYHSRQCGIVLKPRPGRTDRALWYAIKAESCENSNGAS